MWNLSVRIKQIARRQETHSRSHIAYVCELGRTFNFWYRVCHSIIGPPKCLSYSK